MDGDGIMRQEFRCCEPFWREDLSSFQICSCSPDTGVRWFRFMKKRVLCVSIMVYLLLFLNACGGGVTESRDDTDNDVESVEIILVEAGEDDMNNGELTFYPKHPSGTKTHKIEMTPMPILEQEEPFDAKTLSNEFCADLDGALAIYEDKRFEVTGIAVKIGPDIHNKPSIEISDEVGGQCYTLCIFPSEDFYDQVSVGDRVTVRANYLVMSNWYGVVMKYSELVKAETVDDSNGKEENELSE